MTNYDEECRVIADCGDRRSPNTLRGDIDRIEEDNIRLHNENRELRKIIDEPTGRQAGVNITYAT